MSAIGRKGGPLRYLPATKGGYFHCPFEWVQQCDHGGSGFLFLILCRYQEILSLLIEGGADLSIMSRWGTNALMLASEKVGMSSRIFFPSVCSSVADHWFRDIFCRAISSW